MALGELAFSIFGGGGLSAALASTGIGGPAAAAVATASVAAAAHAAGVIWVVVKKEWDDHLVWNFATGNAPGGGDGDPTLSYGSNTGNTKGNANRLRRDMEAKGVEFKSGEAAHHIVPSTHKYAKRIRELLQEFGIDINSAANGVPLPGPLHDHLSNSYGYIDKVYEWLSTAETTAQAERTLRQIGELLRMGKFFP